MTHSDSTGAWAFGRGVFGAATMLILGVCQTLMGIAAVIQDEILAVARGYLYTVDTTIWGWVHIAIGVVAILLSLFIYRGARWARALGIIVAILTAVANFLFLPYYPFWSLVLIPLALFTLWPLSMMDTVAHHRASPVSHDRAGVPGAQRWGPTNPPPSTAPPVTTPPPQPQVRQSGPSPF